MSDARQRFDALTCKGDPNQSTKSIHIDDVVDKREGIQEAAKALKDGKMPTTNQVTEVLDAAKDVKLRDNVELSTSGQRVAEKLDQALDSTKRLIQDKNKDNEIQQLIHHSKLASQNLDNNLDSKDAQKTLQKAYSNLVVLAQLVVTSSEFRGTLGDLYNIFRDVLKENDIPGASQLPKAEEITTNDGRIDTNKVKQQSQNMTQQVKDETYQQLNSEQKDQLDELRFGDRQEQKEQIIDTATQSLGQTLKPIVDKASQGLTQDARDHSRQMMEDSTQQFKGLKDEKTSQAKNLANEAQSKAKDTLNQTQEAFKNMSLSDEQLELLADRLAAVLEEVQSQPQYQRAVEGLLDVLYNIKNNTETAAMNAKDHIKGDGDYDVSEAVSNAKKVIENFAGHYSLDKLIQYLNQFSNQVDKDITLKKLMKSNYDFILGAIQNRQFIRDEQFNDKAVERFKATREYVLKSYQPLSQSVMSEGNQFINALKEDPTTNQTVSDLENLTKELFMDEQGRPTVKYDLLQDFNKFIPVLSKHLQKLKIPKISDKDDSVEYILDNITLTCDNIAPRTVRVRTDTEFDTEEDRIKNVISVKMQGIQAAAREVAFYFKKKTLLANVEDAGLVNVVIDGHGLDVFLKLAPKTIEYSAPDNLADQEPTFNILESKCRVNDIHVKFQHGKYDLLYKMFNKVIQSTIRKQIEQGVSNGIREFLQGVNRAIASRNNEPKELKESKPLDPSPDGWKSDAFGSKH